MKLLLALVSQVLSKDQCQTALVVEFSSHLMGSISYISMNSVKFQKYRQHIAKIKVVVQETVTISVALSTPTA